MKYLEIREHDKNKTVVKRFNVSDKTDNMIDKFERGVNINLNHQKFYTVVYESDLILNEI